MEKTEPDADAVDMASDVLKLFKAREMLAISVHDKTRLIALKVLARAQGNGAEVVYAKILERRSSC